MTGWPERTGIPVLASAETWTTRPHPRDSTPRGGPVGVVGGVQRDEDAVHRFALRSLFGLVDQAGEGFAEFAGRGRGQPQVAQAQQVVGRGAVDLLGEGAEQGGGADRLRLGDEQLAGRPPVVPLGAAAYRAGAGDTDQSGVAQHLEVMGEVALLRVEEHRELADRGRPLGQGEQQSLAQWVGQSRVLLGRADVLDVLRGSQAASCRPVSTLVSTPVAKPVPASVSPPVSASLCVMT